jgi:hypothetical protein
VKSLVVASLLTPVIIVGAALGPASAQPLRPEVAGLPPFEIVAILRSAGFEPLARPVRGAGVFFVRALDPNDDDVRLTVDARSGRIMAVRSMSVAASVYRPSMHRGYPAVHGRPFDDGAGFEDATGALPIPPRAVPGGGTTFGYKSTLPLPRPRPSQAMATPSAAKPAEAAPKPTEAAPASDKPAAAAKGGVELPPVTPLE